MTFRFIHTADLHLDSPLISLALRNRDLAAEVAVASRIALKRIVDLCLTEKVDALLIAGDLWDGGQTSAKTPRFLKQELMRLSDAGVRCFILRGNHDAASKITKELEAPPLCHIFGTKAATQSFDVGAHSIAIHGMSFAEGAVPESLLPRYPAPIEGAFNIGMMHTSLNGSARHDVYAPCHISDLDTQGYDYWALGHIHKRTEHHGRSVVVMPGIPQGRDIGEAGATSVTLGLLNDNGHLSVEQRCVAALRFERLPVDLSGVTEWTQAIAALTKGLQQIGGTARAEDHLVLRPELTGQTPLAFRIARDMDQLQQEAIACAEGLARVWIDKVENATTSTGPDQAQLPADLMSIVTGDLPKDPALLATLADLARELLLDLPPDLRNLLGDDEAALHDNCAALLAQGTAQLLPRLTMGEGE